jgi:hypothetical protein
VSRGGDCHSKLLLTMIGKSFHLESCTKKCQLQFLKQDMVTVTAMGASYVKNLYFLPLLAQYFASTTRGNCMYNSKWWTYTGTI